MSRLLSSLAVKYQRTASTTRLEALTRLLVELIPIGGELGDVLVLLVLEPAEFLRRAGDGEIVDSRSAVDIAMRCVS